MVSSCLLRVTNPSWHREISITATPSIILLHHFHHPKTQKPWLFFPVSSWPLACSSSRMRTCPLPAMPPSPCLQSRPADPPPPSYSVYSAHEHSALHASPSVHASSLPSLPADIVAETLLSVLVVVTGIVLSSAPLKPIQWSVWAGEAEREEARRRIGKGSKVAPGEAPGGNPFAWITEDRVGFWDGRVSCLLPIRTC